MQNKGAIQVFAILLTLACLYHLSFTFLSQGAEKTATEVSGGDTQKKKDYLDSIAGDKLPAPWGWLGFTYTDAKLRELNLGLDLKGGMNVTLEVSIPDLLKAMTKNSPDSAFNQALRSAEKLQETSQANFVDLFVEEYERINPNGKLANSLLFGHSDQSAIKTGMSNDEVRSQLKIEADQAVDRTYEVLMARIDAFGVTQPNIQKLEGTDRILVELPGVQNPEEVQGLLQASAKLEFWMTYESFEALQVLDKVDGYLARRDSLSAGVVDTNQVADSLLTAEQRDSIRVADSLALAEKAALDSASAATLEGYKKQHPLFAVLQPFVNTESNQYIPGPIVGNASISDTAQINAFMRDPKVKELMPTDLVLAWASKPNEKSSTYLTLYSLRKNPTSKERGSVLEGDVITDASYQIDDKMGGYRVEMKMSNEGADEWAKITREAISDPKNKKAIAIVLDGKVVSAPTVQNEIQNGISSITGNFGYDEAKTLASVLKAGKLPTPATIVEQAVVGPSLGQKAINSGLISLGIAFLIILIYMAFYYGRAGLVADVALLTNVFFLIGSLSALGTTLTLPGITGILLTIGMSVDANVLIFERIREELRQGKGIKMALSDGYKAAYRAIIDSNVTTLLIALILIIFGAGPVKGFAVTLFIGILTSMFSAIFISRLIFEWMLTRKKTITFSNKMTENVLVNANFNFVGRRKIFYFVSGLLVVAGIASFALRGFNLGVDLQGGRSYTVTFDNADVNVESITAALETPLDGAPIVKPYGGNNTFKIITKYKLAQKGPEVDKEVEQTLYEGLKPLYTKNISADEFSSKTELGIMESYKVGPTVARDVKIKSIYAVALSLLIMFLYILFRFRGWQYALGAILALAHDVVIVLAMFSIFDGILPFSLELDQAIIAAVLTVIGYSINDTVIIFDRIREFLGEGRKDKMSTLINKALNNTLGRTINTSLTVMFVLVIAFIFGGDSIKGLTFAILVGVVVGTYSSICIATPIVVDLKKDKKADEKKPVKA